MTQIQRDRLNYLVETIGTEASYGLYQLQLRELVELLRLDDEDKERERQVKEAKA